MRAGIILGLGVMLAAGQVRAGETQFQHVAPSSPLLAQLTAALGGVDLANDQIADELAAIAFCPLVKRFAPNDFDWADLRIDLRKSIAVRRDTMPHAFTHYANFKLAAYDSERQRFPFTEDSKVVGNNALILWAQKPEKCRDEDIKLFPTDYTVELNRRLDIPAMPLSPEKGRELAEKMRVAGNSQRMVYAVLGISIDGAKPTTRSNYQDHEVRAILTGRVNYIDFYSNPERTDLITRIEGEKPVAAGNQPRAEPPKPVVMPVEPENTLLPKLVPADEIPADAAN